MTMAAEEQAPASGPVGVAETAVISGMRPARRDSRAVSVRRELAVGSVWAPCAAVAWLLALTPAAVIAVKFDFLVAMGVGVIQAALILAVLMRFAWRRRIHVLLVGVGALFTMLLLAMISFDRSEYRGDLERFDSTVRGFAEPGGE